MNEIKKRPHHEKIRGRISSAVPPQFADISQHLPRRVSSHPNAVTGIPGKAYAGNDPFSPQLTECIQSILPSAPLILRQLSVRQSGFYFFPVNIIKRNYYNSFYRENQHDKSIRSGYLFRSVKKAAAADSYPRTCSSYMLVSYCCGGYCFHYGNSTMRLP